MNQPGRKPRKALRGPAVVDVMPDEDLLRTCQTDLYRFCKVILGYGDMEAEPHAQMCRFFEDPYPRKLMVGARGYYKTSLGTVGRPIQRAINDPEERLLIVSNTMENGRQIVSQIRDHWDQNPRLRLVAGHLIPRNTRTTPWGEAAVQLNRKGVYGEPTFTAAGVDTQLAGRHYTGIFGDDVVAANRDDLKENAMILLRPEEVDKAIGWYKLTMRGMAIMRAGGKPTTVQFIVNRWAMHDFAQYVMDNHLWQPNTQTGFKFLQVAVRDREGTLTWPTVFTEEKLTEIRQDQGEFMYWTQYECQPHDPANRGFPEELNVYDEDLYNGIYPPNCEEMNCFAIMDQGDKTKPAHCPTALIVVYVDHQNHIWVSEEYEGRIDPSRKIDLFYDVMRRHPQLHNTIHVEENLYLETLQFGLRPIMEERGQFRIIGVKTHNRNKDERILRLQPHHERGAIHLRRDLHILKRQLRDFPHSPRKDLLDALGHIMQFVHSPGQTYQREVFDDTQVTVRDLKDRMRHLDRMKRWGGGRRYSLQMSNVG